MNEHNPIDHPIESAPVGGGDTSETPQALTPSGATHGTVPRPLHDSDAVPADELDPDEYAGVPVPSDVSMPKAPAAQAVAHARSTR